MANNYDGIDLRFSWNGDYTVSTEGDIGDTSDDALLALKQDIHTVCASAFEDWALYPNLGASLRDFIGEPNTRRTGAAIHDRLRLALVSAGVVTEEDLEIRVIPVHRHRVLIIVKVHVLPTSFNRMDPATDALRVALVFDFIEQGVHFLGKVPELTSGG